ncbi:hypothetical protein QCA50_014410 [Cerrena zonata]|uniref:Galactose mutarotase-like protein n=1 Tax=Cerrena zonata TaxID=2478898 RepID=A0AAW0FUS5_9APHY
MSVQDVPVFLALPSLTPAIALEVLPRGLTIHRLYIQADGRTHDLVVGPEDPKGHLTQKYTNTIVGRYANRLPTTPEPFILSKNNLSSTFSPQSNESPTVSLHGGPTGFDSQVFTPQVDLSSVQLFTAKEKSEIEEKYNNGSGMVFSLISESGDQGFPGKLLVEVLVSLVEPKGPQTTQPELNLGAVVIVYRAKLLDEAVVTPINLTQHWGFNLDASLKDEIPDSLSVKEHALTIKSDHTIELDASGLSTGELLPVKGTHHAHAEKASGKIGENWPESGYDHFYVFNKAPPASQPTRISTSSLSATTSFVEELLTKEGQQIDPVVVIASDRSGLRLTFDTNQSGVQFYSNNLTNPSKGARKKIHGGSGISGHGDSYGVGTAAFLEFHEPLGAWLHPKTQGISKDDTLLASGEVYNNFVRMDVWFKSPGPSDLEP